jgi:hypothetical protein
MLRATAWRTPARPQCSGTLIRVVVPDARCAARIRVHAAWEIAPAVTGYMSTPPDTASLEAMIAELVSSAAGLAEAASENARVLGDLVAARSALAGAPLPPADGDGVGDLDGDMDSLLQGNLREIVTLQAQATGVTVGEYVEAAVLAYIALSAPAADGDGALAARAADARRTTRRVRAENRAVRAQSERAIAQGEKLQADARRRDGGGSPPPQRGD